MAQNRENTPAGRVTLRLPPWLKVWIGRQAAANRRTLNGEIVFRLEATRLADEQSQRPPSAGAPAGQV